MSKKAEEMFLPRGNKTEYLSVSKGDLEGNLSEIINFLQELQDTHRGMQIRMGLDGEDIGVNAYYERAETLKDWRTRCLDARKSDLEDEKAERAEWRRLNKIYGKEAKR